MIEGLFSIITAIAEALLHLISSLINFIAGFFVAAGETLTLIDLMMLLLVLFLEMVYWFILWTIELTVALFKWRKPHRIKKPIIWRPKPKKIKQQK